MQGSHAESYARLIADRVAEIPMPEQFRDPEILIAGDGIEVSVATPTAERPRPVLTVGERLAVEAPRDVVKGVIAVRIAHAHLGTPEPAGQWAPLLLMFSGIFAVFGLATGLVWFLFLGGLGAIGGVLGWRSRIDSDRLRRQRVFDADELAAGWVGRQGVVDGLRWLADRPTPAPGQPGPVLADRLAQLGA